MCAYNAIYGFPACASPLLLKQKLRGAWKFQGFVTSDCGAIGDFYSTQGYGQLLITSGFSVGTAVVQVSNGTAKIPKKTVARATAPEPASIATSR